MTKRKYCEQNLNKWNGACDNSKCPQAFVEKEDLTFSRSCMMQPSGCQVIEEQEKGRTQQQRETFRNAE
jgi:hypothetical protein